MWLKNIDGAYVNANNIRTLVTDEPESGVWRIKALYIDGASNYLPGDYTSAANALEAARILVQGFDPSALAD